MMYADKTHRERQKPAEGRPTSSALYPADALRDLSQSAAQLKGFGGDATISEALRPAAPDRRSLPNGLRSSVERLSGFPLGDVTVHYNSAEPARIQAHAYTRGTDIHVAPGQEKHLPHETWHVVQQKQGRVKPTHSLYGDASINDDPALEREAEVMGARALAAPGSAAAPSLMGADGFGPGSPERAARQMSADSTSARRPPQEPVTGRFENGATERLGGGTVVFMEPDGTAHGKEEFLAALEQRVRRAADAVLAEVGQTSEDCPYIRAWFAYYAGRSARNVRRAVARFAPAAYRAETYEGFLSAIVDRAVRGLQEHVDGRKPDIVLDELGAEAPARGGEPRRGVVAEARSGGPVASAVTQFCRTREGYRRLVDLQDGEEEEAETAGANSSASGLPATSYYILDGARYTLEELRNMREENARLIEALRRELVHLEELRRQVDEVARLRALMAVQDALSLATQPDFTYPPEQSEEEVLRMIVNFRRRGRSALAARTLIKRLQSGLIPASRLTGVPLSGDKKAADVVSVNVLPPSQGERHENYAEFSAYNRAGGAGPIAIEQFGDSIQGGVDAQIEATLGQRAVDSAVLVIDPAKLPPAEHHGIETTSRDGGERGLGEVPPDAIVAVLAPAVMYAAFSAEEIERYHLRFVGAVTRGVYYAGLGREVMILHPDFKSGLTAVFQQNPGKTLVIHTTRLGPEEPICLPARPVAP